MSVKLFIVMAPPQTEDPDPASEAERMVFVKDGFSLAALLVPFLWLLWNRMWLPLLAYIAYLIGLSLVELQFGQVVSTIIAAGCGILLALEANNLRRWSLGAKGWRIVGEAIGRNRDEAEFLFFRDWANRNRDNLNRKGREAGSTGAAGSAPNPFSGQPRNPAPVKKPDDEPAIFGLFPEADH
jgi:hypothetical protein